MPIIVGILKFMIRTNFMLIKAEHEHNFELQSLVLATCAKRGETKSEACPRTLHAIRSDIAKKDE